MNKNKGLPGLRGLDHVGFTVPDIEAATRFFLDVLGCELIYAIGPIADPHGDWMQKHLNVPRTAVIRELRLLRCGFGSNFEIFEYDVADQASAAPRNCDVGGHHLAFYVDNIEQAMAHLLAHGVTLLGEPTVRQSGPSAGQTWIYFLAPWGMHMELVSFPNGKGYERDAKRLLWNPCTPAE
ncbi:VOC family protein [Pseudoduganella sp. OTU4001]|uniref:VOC family protein n=1 Tax=Pseudoduganella sp. OTU4001 TaxID=3043854 RepID=UPI00313E5DE3